MNIQLNVASFYNFYKFSSGSVNKSISKLLSKFIVLNVNIIKQLMNDYRYVKLLLKSPW